VICTTQNNQNAEDTPTADEKKLVLDLKKTQQTRASVRVAIEVELDKLLEIYTPELYNEKCNIIQQHVYESYWGKEQSICK
jgi:type I restriction enzyme R subunit